MYNSKKNTAILKARADLEGACLGGDSDIELWSRSLDLFSNEVRSSRPSVASDLSYMLAAGSQTG